jgi:hypothetical protein
MQQSERDREAIANQEFIPPPPAVFFGDCILAQLAKLVEPNGLRFRWPPEIHSAHVSRLVADNSLLNERQLMFAAAQACGGGEVLKAALELIGWKDGLAQADGRPPPTKKKRGKKPTTPANANTEQARLEKLRCLVRFFVLGLVVVIFFTLTAFF